MTTYQIRIHLENSINGCSISRKAFESLFIKTKETVRFTLNGWDGKSYDGESRNAKVYRTTLEGFSHARFIKVGKAIHLIDEDRTVLEKATGEYHLTCDWLVDVDRA